MPSEINLGDVQNDALQSLEAKIATDSNGDFVIEDSNENVVARYDEANSTWVLTSLSTDDLRTTPRGALIDLSSAQSIANDTITEVAFDNVVWETDSAANLSNNQIVVPSGYDWAQMTVYLRWTDNPNEQLVFPSDPFAFGTASRANLTADNNPSFGPSKTAWGTVSLNDTFSVGVRQRSGGSLDLTNAYLEVRLL